MTAKALEPMPWRTDQVSSTACDRCPYADHAAVNVMQQGVQRRPVAPKGRPVAEGEASRLSITKPADGNFAPHGVICERASAQPQVFRNSLAHSLDLAFLSLPRHRLGPLPSP